MIDNIAVIAPDGILRRQQNYYLEEGELRGRPGTVQLGSNIASGKVQALPYFQERISGTRHSLAIVAGELYEYTYATDTWAIVSTPGITISTTADIDWCVFNDRLVITDGVNKPWTWDGQSGFQILNDAPVARNCTVYFLKLFFADLPAAPSRFMWSEEGDPTVGYLGPHPNGGAFDNKWDFGQTDAGRIVALTGLNEALIVWKEDSIAAVRGPVEEQFQTSGVREGIDDKKGVISARSIIVRPTAVSYLATDGPKEIRGGIGKPIDLEQGRLDETWAELRRTDWATVPGLYDPIRRHDIWAMPLTSSTFDWMIAYSSREDAARGLPDQGFSYFNGWDVSCFGVYEDTIGMERVVYGDGLGNVFYYGAPDAWDDNGVATKRVAEKMAYGADLPGMRNYDLVEFFFRLRSDANITVLPIIDSKDGPAISREVSAGSYPKWGKAKWNVDTWGPAGGELAGYSRGLNAEARGCGWRLIQNELNNTIDIVGVRMRATQAHDFPMNV